MKVELRKIIDALRYVAFSATEAVEYRKSWGDEFCMKQLTEALQICREYLEEVDVQKLDEDELRLAGFEFWTEETVLCPLYFQPILKPNSNNDVRFGCIADGWQLKDGHINLSENKDIFSDKKEVPR